MKNSLIRASLVAALSIAVARAESSGPVSVISQQTTEAQRTYSEGRTLLITGIVGTVLGGGVMAGGIALAASENCSDDGDCGGHVVSALGSTIGLMGAVTMGAGVVFWIAGHNKMSRAQRMGFTPATMRATIVPSRGGVVAGLEVGLF